MTDQSTKILCAFVAGAFVGAFLGKMYYDVKAAEEGADEHQIASIEEDKYTAKPTIVSGRDLIERASYDIPEAKEMKPPKEYGVDDMDIKKDPGVDIVSSDDLDDGYESIALTYYTKDDILVDDMDMPVDNIRATLGDKFYKEVENSMDDTLYIRNDKVKAIFEVSIIHGHIDWSSPHE